MSAIVALRTAWKWSTIFLSLLLGITTVALRYSDDFMIAIVAIIIIFTIGIFLIEATLTDVFSAAARTAAVAVLTTAFIAASVVTTAFPGDNNLSLISLIGPALTIIAIVSGITFASSFSAFADAAHSGEICRDRVEIPTWAIVTAFIPGIGTVGGGLLFLYFNKKKREDL